jgi:predicted RNA-binding Zn-ribbon protein involved in translation (DUF1610 family)
VTIRDYFQRLMRRITLGIGVSVMVIAGILIWRYPNMPSAVLALVAGAIVSVPTIYIVKTRFLCPRCGANMDKLRRGQIRAEQRGQVLTERADPGLMFWVRWNACPQCGVSFDAEYGSISG